VTINQFKKKKKKSKTLNDMHLAQIQCERGALRVACLHVVLQVDVEKLENKAEVLIHVDDV
jgi:hypothetical protein